MQRASDTGTAPSASVRIYLPDERLRSFATFYYVVDCQGALEDFLYPEWGNIRFTTRGTWWVEGLEARQAMPQRGALFGPTDRAARVITRDGSTAGFGLTPLGWERFFAVPADALANRIVTLGDHLGTREAALHDAVMAAGSDADIVALFDQILLDRLAGTRPNSEVAIIVDTVLRDRPHSIDDFAAAASLSPRQLLRVCNRVFGFGPKRLLRRQRFLGTLGEIRITDAPRFTSLLDPEYFDQAHFYHEFKEFMGVSPKEYLSVPRPLMGQAALVQLQAGIPLSFKLPPPPEDAVHI